MQDKAMVVLVDDKAITVGKLKCSTKDNKGEKLEYRGKGCHVFYHAFDHFMIKPVFIHRRVSMDIMAYPGSNVVIIGNQAAAIKRSDILGIAEAQDAKIPHGAGMAVLVPGAKGLRGIFNHP